MSTIKDKPDERGNQGRERLYTWGLGYITLGGVSEKIWDKYTGILKKTEAVNEPGDIIVLKPFLMLDKDPLRWSP